MNRRFFLYTGILSLCLFLPTRLLASWNKKAFQSKDMDSANAALGDSVIPIESSQVQIHAKDLAENAAVVPITISTTIKNAQTIRLYVEKNPTPLIATFHLTPFTDNTVSIRTKMRETSDIIAIVEADNKLYMAKHNIKVVVGGCG